uniref:Uncharacterized protein n=1 Tax=Anabas testudineus TaxID=64144 RepID=A0A3Q1J733_ANATE
MYLQVQSHGSSMCCSTLKVKFFTGGTVSIMDTTAFSRDMPSHLVCGILLVVQDNDPKHTSRLCESYLSRKEGHGLLHQIIRPLLYIT